MYKILQNGNNELNQLKCRSLVESTCSFATAHNMRIWLQEGKYEKLSVSFPSHEETIRALNLIARANMARQLVML